MVPDDQHDHASLDPRHHSRRLDLDLRALDRDAHRLSIVHDLVVEASGGSRLMLVLTHVIAAAIIIPTLTARLPQNA